jgi:hypothetical protein
MSQNHREKQSDPEFVTSFTQGAGGIFAFVGWPGSEGTSSGPFATLEGARGWAAKIVREVLRARIDASGTARCGERPAFVEDPDANHRCLEAERRCKCDHLEGLHRVDGNCPVVGCGCEWFEPAYEPPTVKRLGTLQTSLEQAGTAGAHLPAGVPREVL